MPERRPPSTCLSRGSRLRDGAGAALLAAALACVDETPPSSPYYDLVDRFASVVTTTETRAVDFGTPAGRAHLKAGWSPDRFDSRRNRSFVAGRVRRSVVRFELFGPRLVEARLTGRLIGGAARSPAKVAVAVNGERVAILDVGRELETHRIEVPAAATRTGSNELTLDQGPGFRADGPRAAWYHLDLGPGTAGPSAAPPRALTTERALFLPPGTQLAFPVLLRPGTSWRASEVRLGGGSRLEILLETDRDGRRSIATLESSGRDPVVELGTSEPQAALLVLAARPTAEEPTEGLLVRGPSLWAPPAAAPRKRTEPDEPRRANVVLYLVDTLRRDRLGCYGYPRPVSPNIDEFAAHATLFEQSIGQSSWTKPAVASIFTGRWPPEHGAVSWRRRISMELDTLAESLHAAGYRTAAFVSNPHVLRDRSYHQGFDELDKFGRPDSKRLTGLAEEWLDRGDPGRPFFLMVHTMDPHAPYQPPQPYRDRFAPDVPTVVVAPNRNWSRENLPVLSALYDGEIAYNDANFGALLTALKARGLYEDTLIVFVSDHGEEFLDHDWWRHGATLHAESINVPLIVKFAGQTEGRRVSEPVQQIDLLPTVLDSVGLPVPEGLDGTSLARPERLSTERPIYSHLRYRGTHHLSVVLGEWKLIRRYDGDRARNSLFHWKSDPGETRDRSRELPIRTAVLAGLVEAKWLATQPPDATDEIVADEEFVEELRALGYLQ